MDYPANYQVKKYRQRELSKQQLIFCETYLAEGIAGKAARIAGYRSPYRSGNALLKCKRILDYLNKRESKMVTVPVTFESKLSDLDHIMKQSIHPEEGTPDFNTGIKAIAEANKMQGHYAPSESKSLNVNVDIDSGDAKDLFSKLLDSAKQDY